MHIDELETPVPVVDIDRMEANITRLQAYLDKHQIANRPHIKTHKIPAIARMQVDAGAVGITPNWHDRNGRGQFQRGWKARYSQSRVDAKAGR